MFIYTSAVSIANNFVRGTKLTFPETIQMAVQKSYSKLFTTLFGMTTKRIAPLQVDTNFKSCYGYAHNCTIMRGSIAPPPTGLPG